MLTVDIKCPKIVKNTLIFDTFSPVSMGFLAYRAQYYLILSIVPPYIPGLEISKLIGVSISKTEIRLSVSKLSKSKLMLLCK